MNGQSERTARDARLSNIEALRLLATAIVIVCHIAQTVLKTDNPYTPLHDYVLDLSSGAANGQELALLLFFYCGRWGNMIFLVCSVWFLLDSDEWDRRKWLGMLAEIWAVSVCMLLCALPVMRGRLSPQLILRSLLPTVFGNNWFLTCYLLFYPIHPLLNRALGRMGDRALTLCAGGLFVIFFVILPFGGDAVFTAPVYWADTYLSWIAIYFLIAWEKRCARRAADSVPLNALLLAVSLAVFFGSVLWLNRLCAREALYEGRMFCLNNSNNPFLLLPPLALFNLARQRPFINGKLNRLAGLSLLIYVIHENVILRYYLRPRIMSEIRLHLGYAHIAGWVLLLSAATFALSALLAALWRRTLGRTAARLSGRLAGALFRR